MKINENRKYILLRGSWVVTVFIGLQLDHCDVCLINVIVQYLHTIDKDKDLNDNVIQ